MQIRIRTCRNPYFQMLVIVFRKCVVIISCFFVILLAHRYADTQIRLYVFLLSRMSTKTKIDFCGSTGDHGGWQVAAAMVPETTSAAEAAVVG